MGMATVISKKGAPVRQLLAFLAHEALEQQIGPVRINRCYAKTKHTAEFAALPRPWQRMSLLRAKRTIELTVKKYGA